MEVLWVVGAIAIMAGLAWVGFKIEPHWVSKDGHRFLCSGQLMNHLGQPQGQWRETRVLINDTGDVRVDQKRFMRRSSSRWSVGAESPTPPRRKAIFLLQGHSGDGQNSMLALRLPLNSRAIPVLRAAQKQ